MTEPQLSWNPFAPRTPEQDAAFVADLIQAWDDCDAMMADPERRARYWEEVDANTLMSLRISIETSGLPPHGMGAWRALRAQAQSLGFTKTVAEMDRLLPPDAQPAA